MMMFICDIANNPDDTDLCSKCNQVSDLWKQLKLASELKFDLRDTVDLLISMLKKLILFCFPSLITLVLLT